MSYPMQHLRSLAAQEDIRSSPLYQEAEEIYRAVRRPGSGQISDATDLQVAPDGRTAVFTGSLVERLEGHPTTRICLLDLETGETQVLTSGPNSDRLPKFSPDGQHVGFLSDRKREGDFQLYLLDVATRATRQAAVVDGWVEYFSWSPSGLQILLGVAEHGADVAGGQGAITSQLRDEARPAWMPRVETGGGSHRGRSIWIYRLRTAQLRNGSPPNLNIWECTWCGENAIVVVVSARPSEGSWYSAQLGIVDLVTAEYRELYRPKDQLGWPSATPAGTHVAVVEAVCSDRGFVAGALKLIAMHTSGVKTVDTRGIDVTFTDWRSESELIIAGQRGLDTVVATFDFQTSALKELWSSAELSIGGRYAAVSFGNDGEFAAVMESFTRAPEVAVVRQGVSRTVRSFDLGYAAIARCIHSVEQITWNAPDEQEIQGWLLRPQGSAPHPLVLSVHGGPIWLWKPTWLARWGLASLMLLRRGFAIFLPNPRGSSGRGSEFARQVVGDMGGADMQDLLSGIDYLAEQGMVDRARLGVMGVSYGGFMTSWLITQDSRFSAAVAISPVTNQVTEQLLSNIPHFVSLFLSDRYDDSGGQYWERSPVMHASKAKTPVLVICGALDRCTPPEEAVQFHNALLSFGIEAVLVTYPHEGHGVSRWPALTDYAVRVVSWLDWHISRPWS
jgi:dipeptidyl aminopeptidase/acylaminoacyl peptidase